MNLQRSLPNALMVDGSHLIASADRRETISPRRRDYNSHTTIQEFLRQRNESWDDKLFDLDVLIELEPE